MAEARTTQGFVHTLARCRQRPSLLALEVAWRWAFGIPAMLLIWYMAARILAATPLDGLGLEQMTVTDPMAAAEALSAAAARLWPGVLAAALWLVPLLLVVWCVVSSVGRGLVLRRMVATGLLPGISPKSTVGTVIALQIVRLAALGASFAVWFGALKWASHRAIVAPMLAGGEPNLVQYFAIVIVASLGLFTLWGVVSWVFSASPLLAAVEGLTFAGSLRAAVTRRSLRGPMVEINLVMGIVKIALVVLAMVFSATPLPFQSVATPEFMRWWYVGVAIWYFVASDFFHVARLVAYADYAEAEAP
ncbi:MAG: hypothetical protein P4L10_00525 [Acidobacteriaceae bacterium]|nr:hypothetical protein [Acidobacteriaceae bacterium]